MITTNWYLIGGIICMCTGFLLPLGILFTVLWFYYRINDDITEHRINDVLIRSHVHNFEEKKEEVPKDYYNDNSLERYR